jgi:hypothetical protein
LCEILSFSIWRRQRRRENWTETTGLSKNRSSVDAFDVQSAPVPDEILARAAAVSDPEERIRMIVEFKMSTKNSRGDRS